MLLQSIKEMVSVFGEDAIRQMIYKQLNSEQVISFTYDNTVGLDVKKIQRHHADKITNIVDLINSFIIWTHVKDVWDSDNDIAAFPNIISVEDLSGEGNLTISPHNDILIECKKVNDYSLTPYIFYNIVYAAERNMEQKDDIVQCEKILDIDGWRDAFPGLHGKQYEMVRSDFELLLKYQNKLGIKMFPLTDIFSDICEISVLVIWD